MRLFIKLMILVLVLALAGPFFIKDRDGQPLLTTSDVKRKISQQYYSAKTGLQRISDKAAHSLGDDQAGKTTLYKWQDTDGQWHYASEPPPDQDVQTIFIDPDTNVMESSGVVIEAEPEKAQPVAPSGMERLPQVLPSPGRMQRAIDKTIESRDQLEQRNEEMKEALIDP